MGSSLIGQLRILLGLETAQFETGAKKVNRDLGQMKKAAEGVTGALELIGVSLGIAAFAEAAKSALEYASSLSDASKQMGITVEQMQILKRGAADADVEWDKLKSGIQKFRITLGEAKAGLPAAVSAFKNIGIDKTQLQSFHDAGDALPTVMEGLKNVGDAATQAAAGKRLFGKAVGDALPLLTQGKEGYDAMTKAASAAGIVTTEQAARADEAKESIEHLADALRNHLAIALAENSDEITHMTAQLEHFIAKIGNAFHFMGQLRTKIAELEVQGNTALTRAAMGSGLLPLPVGQAHIQQNNAKLHGMQLDQREADLKHVGSFRSWFPELAHGTGGSAPPPNTLDLTPTAHHRSRGRDHTEERAKEAEKLRYDLEKEEIDDKKQLVEAQRALTIDTEDRNALADQALQLDHDQRVAEIDHNLTMVRLDRTIGADKKDEAEKSAVRQRVLNDNLLLLHKQGNALEAELAREGEFEKSQSEMFDHRRSRLDAEEKLATTTAERRRIELELLNLSYEEKKAQLKRIIETQYMGQYTHTADDRTRAQLALDALEAGRGAAKADVLRSTAGPLEELRNSIPQTADAMNEALQSIAAQGLTQVRDGLAETSASWIKMGGVAGDTIRMIYSSLMKLALSKGLSALLGAFRFGGGSAAETVTPSGGVALNLPAVPRFAGGGSMMIGGMAGIDRNLLSLNGMPIAHVSQGERLDIAPTNDRGGAGGSTYVFKGNLLTPEFWAQIQSMDDASAARGAVGGLSLTKRELGRSGRRRLG